MSNVIYCEPHAGNDEDLTSLDDKHALAKALAELNSLQKDGVPSTSPPLCFELPPLTSEAHAIANICMLEICCMNGQSIL